MNNQTLQSNQSNPWVNIYTPAPKPAPKVRDFSKCPRCNSPTTRSKAHSGNESEFWLECTKCNTYINTYIPMAHQSAVHKDPHRYIGNFGGYGTGKTTTTREEIYKHIFLTPSGNTLIGANILPQYEQTIKRELEADIPAAFVQAYSTQKAYMDIINGHRILYRPFDDPDKLRSLNLSMFVMVEGSECKESVFTQLRTRLRNTAAAVPETDENNNIIYDYTDEGVPIPRIKHDWRKGIVESNPDSGWIRSSILLKSGDIQKHGKIKDVYAVLAAEKDPNMASHVATTDVNKFLPPNFIEELSKNRPEWWIRRYVYSSFLYAEGLVYPSAMKHVVPTFTVPKHWKRICAYDYGLSDDSVFLFGAIDEIHSLLFIYKEVRTNDRSVEQLAKIFKEASADIPVGGWLTTPIIDPKSGPKRDYEKKTLADHFLDYGIAFKPGYVNVDARVYRLNTYLESGKLKIMDCCMGLIKELREYKFQAKKFDEDGWGGQPEDKNNHGINPLEWIVMELPSNPKYLLNGVYDKYGENLTKPKKDYKDHYYIHALSDEDSGSPSFGAFDMVNYNDMF